jgi:hypothetical protein
VLQCQSHHSRCTTALSTHVGTRALTHSPTHTHAPHKSLIDTRTSISEMWLERAQTHAHTRARAHTHTHTHTHTHLHTHTCTLTHTHSHSQTHAHMHACTHTRTYTRTHKMHTLSHTRTQALTHSRLNFRNRNSNVDKHTHTLARTHTHAHTHAHTRTHTHTHTHCSAASPSRHRERRCELCVVGVVGLSGRGDAATVCSPFGSARLRGEPTWHLAHVIAGCNVLWAADFSAPPLLRATFVA